MTGRWRVVAWAVVGLGVGLLLATVLATPILVGQIRTTQVDRIPKADKSYQTLRIIKSCTTPGKPCYKRGKRQMAAAVGDIGSRNILAVVCALQVPNGTPLQQALDQVTDCVAQRLAH